MTTNYYTQTFSPDRSSNINTVWFDAVDTTLYVQFYHSDTIYGYRDVRANVYGSLLAENVDAHGSVGSYYSNWIKGRYGSFRVEAEDYMLERPATFSAPADSQPVFTVTAVVTSEFEVTAKDMSSALAEFIAVNPEAVVESIRAN